ncbi:GTP-binding protein (p) alpha subunit, gpa1 [Reticulomyxa filosa]|uniref:GTP-binding protein (P) alpha subunit, gpa1 n=1 Tax=Reticulomyxa filosa TaxID=46433 RepID=X6M4P5_RETFI|nr:GTP-binding protein (p) alpha subunit, gpa1 [Reticulomyxa filosa]|eukprot:ETO08953.1 GTP-binding protein (p) alpha subunit, gpa1 [Reticulomyxa filosa]
MLGLLDCESQYLLDWELLLAGFCNDEHQFLSVGTMFGSMYSGVYNNKTLINDLLVDSETLVQFYSKKFANGSLSLQDTLVVKLALTNTGLLSFTADKHTLTVLLYERSSFQVFAMNYKKYSYINVDPNTNVITGVELTIPFPEELRRAFVPQNLQVVVAADLISIIALQCLIQIQFVAVFLKNEIFFKEFLLQEQTLKREKSDPDAQINKHLRQEAKEIDNLLQIFLLGPGDSGKTTVLKQMKKMYGMADHEKSGYVYKVYPKKKKIEYAMMTTDNIFIREHPVQPKYILETDVDKSLYDIRDEFANYKQKPVLSEDTVEKIEKLWNDEGFKKTLEYRALYQLPDNVAYFLDKIREISKTDYVPSFDDYIRFRFRTTGFASERFVSMIDKKKYIIELTDVGGQRSERRKWLSLDTSKINAVLYVLAISEYDMHAHLTLFFCRASIFWRGQMLFEDNKVRRLDEAYDLFVEVMKTGFIVGKTCVIFFNKFDLFQEKLLTIPISSCFPDFPENLDSYNPRIVCDWLFARYQVIYNEHCEKADIGSFPELHYHCTTALDTDLMEGLLKDIQLDLIKNKLANADLMKIFLVFSKNIVHMQLPYIDILPKKRLALS